MVMTTKSAWTGVEHGSMRLRAWESINMFESVKNAMGMVMSSDP